MGYFDTIAGSSFKISPEGETLFYPNGFISKGRVVPDEETKLKLFNFQKKLYKLSLFVMLPYSWLLGITGAFSITYLIPLTVFVFYFLYKQRCLVRGLARHDLRLSFKEAVRKGSKALPNWYYWLLASASICTIASALSFPALCNKPFLDFLFPVMSLVFLGVLGLVLSIKMYQFKNAENNQTNELDAVSFTKELKKPRETKYETQPPESSNNSSVPKLLVILLAIIALFVYSKLSNPYQKYSSEGFWRSATIEDVYDIPAEALLPGNKNGPVLMWAASITSNPQIISTLVDRGMDVNEREVDFNGTALSAAAYQNRNPEIIDVLVQHGAEVNAILGVLKKSPLLLAAEGNVPQVTERLLFHGADKDYRDATGKTAPMLAVKFKNERVVEFYKQNSKR